MSAAIDPPVTDAAYETCEDVLLPLVARTWRRLRSSIRALELDGPSPTWHAARIKAKRARYAADAVAPIFGKDMKQHARMLADVTELLGDHQDAHVAQVILRELASHADVDGLTGMSLGILYEFEADEEILDRYRFAELWPSATARCEAGGDERMTTQPAIRAAGVVLLRGSGDEAEVLIVHRPSRAGLVAPQGEDRPR